MWRSCCVRVARGRKVSIAEADLGSGLCNIDVRKRPPQPGSLQTDRPRSSEEEVPMERMSSPLCDGPIIRYDKGFINRTAETSTGDAFCALAIRCHHPAWRRACVNAGSKSLTLVCPVTGQQRCADFKQILAREPKFFTKIL